MKKLYTAVGQLHFRGNLGANRCPILVVNGNETTPNMSEMILWSTLYWQILTEDELDAQFEAKKKEVNYADSMSASAVMYWMTRRGLIEEGVGDTYEDALYDLLSRLYITPIEVNPLLDVVSFFRMMFSDGLPIKTALQVFNRDKRSDGEKKIMKLIHKVKLTTAETIRCFAQDVMDLQNEDEVVEKLYQDDYTTSENIADEMRSSLLRHVNYRITSFLKSSYPNVTWNWCEEYPENIAANVVREGFSYLVCKTTITVRRDDHEIWTDH